MSSADRTPSRRRATLAALVAAALVGTGTVVAVAASGDDRDPAATSSSARPDGGARDADRDEGDEGRDGDGTAGAAAAKTDVRAAVAAALAKTKGVVASAEFDEDGDRSVWEVEVVGTNGADTEVLVDPDAGTVLDSTRDKDDDTDDSGEDRKEAAALRKAGTDAGAAAAAAVRKVPGTVVSVDFEHDGDDDRSSGAPVWEVEVIGDDGKEHEVRVDAGSGKTTVGADEGSED